MLELFAFDTDLASRSAMAPGAIGVVFEYFTRHNRESLAFSLK